MEAISQYISKLFRTSGKRAKQSLLLPEGLCRRFSLAEIKIATNNFDEDSVIGEGAFGKIYKGFIGDCTVSAAVKRKSSTSRQGFEEFGTEILRTRQLTDKTDVYGLGVVLFEVLCTKITVDMKLEREQQSLAIWALKCVEDGTINQMIDPCLIGKIAPECFKIYVNIATSCVREDHMERPTIGEVEASLEHALEQQKRADAATRKDDSI